MAQWKFVTIRVRRQLTGNVKKRRDVMGQNGKEPHGGDGQVLSIGMALGERRAVHEEDGHSDGDVERQAEGGGVQDAVSLAQHGVRPKAELDLAEEVQAVNGPRPKREVCDERAASIGVTHAACGLDGGGAEVDGEDEAEEAAGCCPAQLSGLRQRRAHWEGDGERVEGGMIVRSIKNTCWAAGDWLMGGGRGGVQREREGDKEA